MSGLKLGKELPDRPEPAILRVFQALANAFVGVGLRGEVELALLSFVFLLESIGLFYWGGHHGMRVTHNNGDEKRRGCV